MLKFFVAAFIIVIIKSQFANSMVPFDPQCRFALCPLPRCPNPQRPRHGGCCPVCGPRPASISRSCPVKGQVFDPCGSLCRQGTCARPPPPFCNGMCVPGCQCPSGMVVNEEINACVPMEECPEMRCPIKGQVFNPCGSACSDICDPDIFCILVCVPRCECPVGTILNKEGNACVPGEKCPKRCPVNGQIRTKCASACPGTCTNPISLCKKPCSPGCECPEGTVINEDTNTCVPVKKCPPKCALSQHHNTHHCPIDKPLVNCFSDPCDLVLCTTFPKATCVADFCGGCNARFFVGRKEVTPFCPPQKG